MKTKSPCRIVVDSDLYQQMEKLCSKNPRLYPNIKLVANQWIEDRLKKL